MDRKSPKKRSTPKPPSVRKTPTKMKKPRKKKVFVQELFAKLRRAFGPNPRCKVDDASTAARLRKTPRGDPERCMGSVRLGQDGSHLYYAQKVWKKNPKIKYSTTPTGQGYHLAFKWTKLYNTRTKKPFKVSDSSKWLS